MNQKLMGSEEVERLDLWEEHEHRHRVHLRQRGPAAGVLEAGATRKAMGLGRQAGPKLGVRSLDLVP